jgi:beta-glucosidase
MTSPTLSAVQPAVDPTRRFPAGFVWGAATAAYQIEGSPDADGRSASIWDTFAHTPGRILGAATGDVACDHYRRSEQDLDLMAELGLTGYRFSISWPRWQPDGAGVEPRGVAFYDRLVDGLLERGIQPWLTLYHWDLPQTLQDAGGWAERDTAHRFADYAASVGGRLGDRVHAITTLNEPWCSAFLGYAAGVHAPGVQDDVAALRAVHHLLLGHGLAMAALRAQGGSARLGIALNVYPVEPLTDRPEDADAVRRIDGLANRILLDPLLRGDYPADVIADLSSITDFDHVRCGDLELIRAPLDLLGENYYNPFVVTAADNPAANAARALAEQRDRRWSGAADGWRPRSPWVGSRDVVFTDRGGPLTAMDWSVEPTGLVDVLLRLVTDYDCPPLYITENGAAFEDVELDGRVDDPDRTDYLAGHLGACLDALAEGVDLRGYFAWSLLDNFEWGWGYAQRFGIVHVDFDTQRRTFKSSAQFLQEVIRSNALLPLTGRQ